MTDALPSRCEACGYDLSGLPTDAVCPECGVDRAGRSPDAIGRCSTCGYDLTGLPEGAPCPECGATQEPLPIDAVAHQPVEMIGRVTSGLAMLAMTPMLVAISALVMIGTLIVLQIGNMRGANADISAGMNIVLGLCLLAVAAVWTIGWTLAATAPIRDAPNAGVMSRHIARKVSAIGCATLGASLVSELVGLWIPLADTIAIGFELVTLLSLGGATIAGVWLLGDIARRLAREKMQRRARRARAAATVVAVAVGFFPLVDTVPALGTGVLGMASMVFILAVVIGPIWLFGALADMSSALGRSAAAIYELKTGRAHWSSHKRWGRMTMRVGDIVRRARSGDTD